MEIKTYQEWAAENPDKNINDYYSLAFGTTTPPNFETGTRKFIDQPSNIPMYMPANLPESIYVKISFSRLFIYTGIIMASSVLWITIFWVMVVLIFGSGFFRDIMLKSIGN
ncbi:hypothetical protein LJ707_18745 [Mucilaginibacter sp. UR6-1]|uniref:hypothetical protein n=1 Tax=Mucilaginibacter sp. UR6-1 TaxID=1435643 RepID=UPI001E5722BB|nr:hypothetical protein [Mucilaginibacter sp. UR6-1]MCC8410985.1 hypothetical protein [Mucilaginibacter sp. UR6-1]